MTGCQVGLVIEGVLHFENQLAEARLRKLPLISEGSSFAHNDFLRSVAKYESGWLMDFRMRNCLHTTNDETETSGRQENSNLLFILIFFSDEILKKGVPSELNVERAYSIPISFCCSTSSLFRFLRNMRCWRMSVSQAFEYVTLILRNRVAATVGWMNNETGFTIWIKWYDALISYSPHRYGK